MSAQPDPTAHPVGPMSPGLPGAAPADLVAQWAAWRARELSCPGCGAPVGDWSARAMVCAGCGFEPPEPPRAA